MKLICCANLSSSDLERVAVDRPTKCNFKVTVAVHESSFVAEAKSYVVLMIKVARKQYASAMQAETI